MPLVGDTALTGFEFEDFWVLVDYGFCQIGVRLQRTKVSPKFNVLFDGHCGWLVGEKDDMGLFQHCFQGTYIFGCRGQHVEIGDLGTDFWCQFAYVHGWWTGLGVTHSIFFLVVHSFRGPISISK